MQMVLHYPNALIIETMLFQKIHKKFEYSDTILQLWLWYQLEWMKESQWMAASVDRF